MLLYFCEASYKVGVYQSFEPRSGAVLLIFLCFCPRLADTEKRMRFKHKNQYQCHEYQEQRALCYTRLRL